jgi:hypothetical protein
MPIEDFLFAVIVSTILSSATILFCERKRKNVKLF